MTFEKYIEKLLCLQAIIWIDEERIVDQLHCLKNLNNPHYQQFFDRFEESGTYRHAVENIMFGLRTGQIVTGPYGP